MTHKIQRCLLTLMLLALLLPGGANAASQALPAPEGSDWMYLQAGDDASAYAINMDNVLYRYQKGQTALEVVDPIAPIPRHDSMMGLAKIEGGVYILPQGSNTLELVYRESGSPKERIPLPLSRDIKGAGKHSYLRHFVYQDGLLYFLISVKDSDFDTPQVCRYDLKKDKATLYKESKGVFSFALMEDGQIILLDRLYQNDEHKGRLRILDTGSGKTRHVVDLPGIGYSIGFDQTAKAAYFISQSYLWRWQAEGGLSKLRVMPVEQNGMNNPGVIMGGKLLAIYQSGLFLADPEEEVTGGLHLIGEVPGGQYHGGVYDRFMLERPDVALSSQHSASSHETLTTGELGQRIQTGMLQYDIMVINTQVYDLKSLIKKGYCLDLSGDEELLAAVQRMHPAIRDQVLVDGKLYGLPARVNGLHSVQYFPNSMDALGLQPSDLPQSFESMVEFLMNWREVSRGQDMMPFPVSNTQTMLKDRLITHYMHHCYKTGQELHFKDPIFVEALEQIDRLPLPKYPENSGMPVLMSFDDPAMKDNVLTLSIKEGGPKIQPARMFVYIVSATTKEPRMAMDYLRMAANHGDDWYRAGLYTDWTEPVEQKGYQTWLLEQQQEEARLKQALNKAKEGSQEARAAKDALAAHQARFLEQQAFQQYAVTQSDLAHYQQEVAPYLSFAPVNPFTSYGEPGGEGIHNTIQRYLKGQLSARQLAEELDGKARLMRLEDGE